MDKDNKKKYKKVEQEPQTVSEPAVSYAVDTNAIKLRMIEEIMHIDNLDKLKQIENLLEELCMPPGKPPCQYNLEELRERIIQGEMDIKAGNYYDAEEVMKDWDKWIEVFRSSH